MGKAARLKQERREARAAAPPARGGRGWIVVLAVAFLGLGSVALAAAMILPGEGGSSATDGGVADGGLARIQSGPPPWLPDEVGLRDRVEAIGVPFAEMEGTAIHIHPRLRLVANGEAVVVPTGIGISYADQGMAALHTHDELGTIHVESPVRRDYTLGQFFDVWGVRLTKRCVGGFCAGRGKQLRAFVDGKAIGGDPRAVTFAEGQRILLAFGTRAAIREATG